MGQAGSKTAKQTIKSAKQVSEERAVLKAAQREAFNKSRMEAIEAEDKDLIKNMSSLQDEIDNTIKKEQNAFYRNIGIHGFDPTTANSKVPVYSKGDLPKDRKYYDFPSEVQEEPGHLNKSQTIDLFEMVKNMDKSNINYKLLSEQFQVTEEEIKLLLKYIVVPSYHEDELSHVQMAYRPAWTKDLKID